MPAQNCLPATEPNHVGEVRRTAQRLAQDIGLAPPKIGNAGIVATELASNLARHAQQGRIYLQTIETGGRHVLELLAVDSGPGIGNLHRSLQDGVSTMGTPGTGFGAVRRLSDEFDAFSVVGRGTVVMSRLWSDVRGPVPAFAFGAMCVPAPYEQLCGDTWRVVEQGQALSVMVADGLGHGPLAAEAADRAAAIFSELPFEAAGVFYERAHRSLTGSRGAALARAVIGPTGQVDYAGVGNIAGSLIGLDQSRGLPSQNGTVGAEMRRQVPSMQYAWPDRGLLLMHSDGIGSRWTLDPYPGLLVRHPALVAATVFRDFLRGRDDATVVVVRRTAPPSPS